MFFMNTQTLSHTHNSVDQIVWLDIIRSGLQSLVTLYNINGDQAGAHRVSKELCRVMVELERIKVRPRKY